MDLLVPDPDARTVVTEASVLQSALPSYAVRFVPGKSAAHGALVMTAPRLAVAIAVQRDVYVALSPSVNGFMSVNITIHCFLSLIYSDDT